METALERGKEVGRGGGGVGGTKRLGEERVRRYAESSIRAFRIHESAHRIEPLIC